MTTTVHVVPIRMRGPAAGRAQSSGYPAPLRLTSCTAPPDGSVPVRTADSLPPYAAGLPLLSRCRRARRTGIPPWSRRIAVRVDPDDGPDPVPPAPHRGVAESGTAQ